MAGEVTRDDLNKLELRIDKVEEKGDLREIRYTETLQELVQVNSKLTTEIQSIKEMLAMGIKADKESRKACRMDVDGEIEDLEKARDDHEIRIRALEDTASQLKGLKWVLGILAGSILAMVAERIISALGGF